MSFDLTPRQLESLFEFYEQNHPVASTETNTSSSRSYHAGRIYGSPGQYGDQDMEDRYQAFISNDKLVINTFDEYIDILENSVPAPNIYHDLINRAAVGAADGAADGAASDYYDNYMASNYYASIYDTIRFEGSDEEVEEEEPRVVMRIIARPTPLEEGEIVDEDVYPNDLLEPEPFIRAPVISAESAEIMADEFTENYVDGYDEEDPYDALLERLQDPYDALREWEASDWVRDHPDPMISRIYVQATDRRY